MALRNHQLFVNLPAHFMDSFCVFSDLRLLPAKLNGAKKGNQGGRGCHDHMVLRAEFNQRRVGLKRRAEERLTRQEADYKIRSFFELLPISLAR